MRVLIITFVLTLCMGAGVAFAAPGDFGEFIPIAPVPGTNGGLATDATSLGDYINSMFRIALAVGATFAVLFIGIGGFEYMMSEALPNKQQGRKRIQSALFGLAILLIVYLVLYVINPDILSLRVLQ